MTRLIPDKLRRYDGGAALDADGVEVARAGLGLPVGSTSEDWAGATATGIAAATATARHALDVVEGLEDAGWRPATSADEDAGYRIAAVVSGTSLLNVSATSFAGASETLAAGTYELLVSLPRDIPSRRVRVEFLRGLTIQHTYPTDGQAWAPVDISDLHSQLQAYRLVSASSGHALGITVASNDTLTLEIGAPDPTDASGLTTRVQDLEAHAVEHYATLPDAADFPVGAVIVVGEDHYVREVSTHTVDDATVAVAGRRSFGSTHLIGASDLSDSGRHPFGRFTANFENRIRAAWAFRTGHSVHVDTAAYTAAHGSAPVLGSTIHCTFTPVGDVPGWTDPYEVVLEVLDAASINASEGETGFDQEGSSSGALYRYGEGHSFSLVVRDGDDATDDILFTHEAGVATWTRWTRSDTDPAPDVVRYQQRRDVQGVPDGAIVVADNALWQAAAPDNANVFSGRAERWESGDRVLFGTALADTAFGARGAFHANLGFAIGAITVGGASDALVALRLESRLYAQYKGSALADGDTVILEATSGGMTTRTELVYQRSDSAPGGDPVYLVFEATDDAAVLTDWENGTEWTARILSAFDATTMTGTPLYTWGIAERHFVEYPVAGTDAAARAQMATLSTHVDDELAKLHHYIAEHVTTLSDEVLDPTVADAPAHYYLTTRARHTIRSISVPWETGLYELTTGDTAHTCKFRMAKVGDWYGFVSHGYMGLERRGAILHNPLSALVAWWVEPSGSSWFMHAVMKSRVRDVLHQQFNLANTATFFVATDGTTEQWFEMATFSQGVLRGVQYDIMRSHLVDTDDRDRWLDYFTAQNSNSPEITVAFNQSFEEAGRANSPLSFLGTAATTKAYTFRDGGLADVTGLGDTVRSPVVGQIVTLTDAQYAALSAPAADTLYLTPSQIYLGATAYGGSS